MKTELNLGFLYRSQGRYKEAETLLKEAVAECQRSDPHSDTSIVALNNLGDLYRAEGKFEAAQELLMQALKECQMGGRDEHPFKGSILTNLGQAALDVGELARAQTPLEAASASQSHATGGGDPRLASILETIGSIHLLTGDYGDAEQAWIRAASIRAAQEDSIPLARTQVQVADLYVAEGRSR